MKKKKAIKKIKFWFKVLQESIDLEPKHKLEINKAISVLKKGT